MAKSFIVATNKSKKNGTQIENFYTLLTPLYLEIRDNNLYIFSLRSK